MPKAIDDFVNSRLHDQDFYPDKAEDERRSLAFALANKLQNEGHLQASLEPITFQLVNAPTQISLQASEGGSILVFKNAILAREETNLNNDEITADGVRELAESIGCQAVDLEHNRRLNAGAFTVGRPVRVKDHWACSVDGFLWPERYPQEVAGVQSGEYQLSIEADAQTAECSICHSKFGKSDEYCKHLRERGVTGARRILYGLKAKGGAITKKPAGTDTRFDQGNIYFVASHAEVTDENKTEESMKCPHCEAENTAEAKTCAKCNKGMEASVIAAELKAALDQLEAAKAQATTLTADRDKAQGELESAKVSVSTLTANLRRTKIGDIWDDAAWEKNKPTVMQMSDEAFDLMASTLQKPPKSNPKPDEQPGGGLRLPTGGNNQNQKEPITLK